MITSKKIIFRRTILDLPLILYLITLIVSSIFSIDPRTSFLGYYSRFNGGLLSQLCYSLLYWAFVSNLTAKQSLSTMYSVLISTTIASTIGVLEHFGVFTTCGMMGLGFNTSCWVQDVQTRVFSTLGQPNWLAAVIVATTPLVWSNSILKTPKIFWLAISIIFFIALLFTGSRSGMLAFGIESIIFWGFIFFKTKFKYLKEFIILFLFLSLLYFFVSFRPIANNQQPTTLQGPSLEVGGTESGVIRKYVWLAAINIFKHYPVFGSGPETFAYTFPMFKPVGHNLTSEWDFIYNKAHNEFLNTLANTGILGFGSYGILIGFILYSFIQKLSITNDDNYTLKFNIYNLALISGFISILVTNFFGFSVVPVSLLFFLFPALAVAGSAQDVEWKYPKKIEVVSQVLSFIVFLITSYLLYATYRYWLADVHYAKSKNFAQQKKFLDSKYEIEKALKLNKNEALYLAQLAKATNSKETIDRALSLNSYDQNIKNSALQIYLNSQGNVEENFYKIESLLISDINLYPNDPNNYFKLARLYSSIEPQKSELLFLKAIEVRNNFKEARYYLGLLYMADKQNDKAKEQFEFILKYIDPNDNLVQKYLKELI